MYRALFAFLLTTTSLWAQRDTPLDRAFNRLYNLDFVSAHKLIDEAAAASPSDPLPDAVKGAAFMFEEFQRLQILESEFLTDDKRVTDKKKVKPDPLIREKFFQQVTKSQQKAKAILVPSPEDGNALFAMAFSTGLNADYVSLIDKKQWGSLTLVRESTDYATKLLKLHPDYTDAYLTTGLTEYIVGSLPFFLRWFIKIDGVEGSKDTARVKLERASNTGRYLEPFAKVMLALYYLREKRPDMSKPFLAELNRRFPNNPLYRNELERLR